MFAYVCFLLALGLIGGAIYILPAAPKVKIFLAAAAALLTSMFAFMAYAAHRIAQAERRKARPGG